MRICAVLAAILLSPGLVAASSPDEWVRHEKEMAAKCIKASGLKEARIVGENVLFGDEVGYHAAMVRGRYPQPHMENAVGHVLCLFNIKTREAQCGEANQWFTPAAGGR
ncbi:MAG: hypothetical protein ACOY3Z_11875 [Thermodesulfobacteriota bacterium]